MSKAITELIRDANRDITPADRHAILDLIEQQAARIAELEAQIAALTGTVDGWKLVPVEPTMEMVIDGFESAPSLTFSKQEDWEAFEAMSGCQRAAHKARLCYAAMLAAAPAATVAPAVDAEAIRREALEEAALVCDEIAVDCWNLYKGRAPYTGSEKGRADPGVQGESDGADKCAAAIRALSQKE